MLDDIIPYRTHESRADFFASELLTPHLIFLTNDLRSCDWLTTFDRAPLMTDMLIQIFPIFIPVVCGLLCFLFASVIVILYFLTACFCIIPEHVLVRIRYATYSSSSASVFSCLPLLLLPSPLDLSR